MTTHLRTGRPHHDRPLGQVAAGMVLVAVGILFLGSQVDLWDGWSFRRLWPIILVVVGVGQVVAPRKAADRRRGWLVMTVGGVLLLHTLSVLSLRQSWPLFLVLNGVAILVGAWMGRSSYRREGSHHVD